jgi:hypothetical protein
MIPITMTADAYFYDVATSVFDEYFQKLGAQRESINTSRCCVRYVTGSWFAEILYLPSDGPKYSPRVLIGCRKTLFDDPRRNRVDVMHTAPVDSEEHDYNLRWLYTSRDELEASLTSVRDRIVTVYAIPYLNDIGRLKALLTQRHDVIEAEWKEEIAAHNDSILRARAEQAFRAKDYELAFQCYSGILPQRRSKIDEAKRSFAMRRRK